MRSRQLRNIAGYVWTERKALHVNTRKLFKLLKPRLHVLFFARTGDAIFLKKLSRRPPAHGGG